MSDEPACTCGVSARRLSLRDFPEFHADDCPRRGHPLAPVVIIDLFEGAFAHRKYAAMVETWIAEWMAADTQRLEDDLIVACRYTDPDDWQAIRILIDSAAGAVIRDRSGVTIAPSRFVACVWPKPVKTEATQAERNKFAHRLFDAMAGGLTTDRMPG